jgi:peptidyl-tRNA hydrolase, PTH1 family
MIDNTVVMKPSLLVVGLGNVGKDYERTRHNAGFLLVDLLAKNHNASQWKEDKKFEAYVSDLQIDGVSILLAKPTTYMNRSGDALQNIISFYKLNPATQVLVLTDDLDIPLGTVRFRLSGGAGTHNGLKSIVAIAGEAFPRLRLGIGPKSEVMDLADWVLSKMTTEEEALLLQSEKEVEKSVGEVLGLRF